MQYRPFGKCGFEVSALGFGCMRLPLVDGSTPIFVERDAANIDESAAIKLIRYAIDHGVNYVDTAYGYHKGNSEPLLGKALKDGYREKVKVATKLPIWLAKTPEDFDRLLNEQLQRLEIDSIDLYLLHALSKPIWEKGQELGVLAFLDRALQDGRIKHVGFSFHDGFPLFKEVVDAYDWSFCQLQYNYIDEGFQAGRAGLEYAASRGLAIVVMEPLRGGKLVKNLPSDAQELFQTAEIKRSPADWAFRWVLNHPEVCTVLSGMNSLEQLQENLETAETALPNSMTEAESRIITQVKNLYQEKIQVNCTECGYCVSCPKGVLIREIFSFYNECHLFSTLTEARAFYARMIEAKRDASHCTECGNCEKICPQHVPIRRWLKEAHAFFQK